MRFSVGEGACIRVGRFVKIRRSMLTLSEITKAYGGRKLFANVSLQVNRLDRIGLVGPNGAGKSTLFSIILGRESVDAGTVTRQRGVTVGHLPQESAPVDEETVIELATAVTPEVVELRRRLRAFEAGHGGEPYDFHEVQARFERLGGYGLEARARPILVGLGFRERDFVRPAREMWRRSIL